MEPSEERQLTDADWAPLRDAVPEVAARWKAMTGEDGYDKTLPFCNLSEIAAFVVGQLLAGAADLPGIGSALEVMYTRIMIADDEPLHGLITVGLLEGLIEAADAVGLPLVRFQELLVGPGTRSAWQAAISWKRPGYVWADDVGPVPLAPVPHPIGTVELHRGWSNRDAGKLYMDVRLLGGTVEPGCLVRHPIGKDMYMEWVITELRLRSPDLPDEFELTLNPVRDESYEVFDGIMGRMAFDDPYWQIAKPAIDTPEW